MKLNQVIIENFKSLGKISLDNLDTVNVLIGRNNSGKSSVFNCLEMFSKIICGKSVNNSDEVITDRDSSKPLSIYLKFELNKEERQRFLRLFCDTGYTRSLDDLMVSPLVRYVDFSFRSPAGKPTYLHLRESRFFAEDAKWATYRMLIGDENLSNPQNRIVKISDIIRSNPSRLDEGILSIDQTKLLFLGNASPDTFEQLSYDAITAWPHQKLKEYFEKSYFFNPFRHSSRLLGVTASNLLHQDGSNLANILHTINSNDRSKFAEIEKFIHQALPDAGALQTPLRETSTEIQFKRQGLGFLVPLAQMGGGIEQLLMIAAVLLTTDSSHPLFIEEPESHLHAGAQRYLMQRIVDDGRQVFITTHSPVFINQTHKMSLQSVTYKTGRTNISPVNCSNDLQEVLLDIGSRNSDVLLSDGVVFVEGNCDKGVFEQLSKKLNLFLQDKNISLIAMGGESNVGRNLPARRDVLVSVSKKSPVPHMFIIDRDERGDDEINKLEKELNKKKLHVLRMREIENYLLNVNVLKRYFDNRFASIGKNKKDYSLDDLNSILTQAIDANYNLVLLKIMKNKLGGLPGGFLCSEVIEKNIGNVNKKGFIRKLSKDILKKIYYKITQKKIEKLYKTERKKLDKIWKTELDKLKLVSGTEVLESVFRHYGFKYKKPGDAIQIVKFFETKDIPGELEKLIRRIIKLVE